MRPSNAHCLRLHEVDLVLHALRFSLGKTNYGFIGCDGVLLLRRSQSDIHGSIEPVKNCLKIFGAKLLTYGTLTILRKSSQSWILPKTNELIRTSQLPSRKFAAHSLHSIVFSTTLRYG